MSLFLYFCNGKARVKYFWILHELLTEQLFRPGVKNKGCVYCLVFFFLPSLLSFDTFVLKCIFDNTPLLDVTRLISESRETIFLTLCRVHLRPVCSFRVSVVPEKTPFSFTLSVLSIWTNLPSIALFNSALKSCSCWHSVFTLSCFATPTFLKYFLYGLLLYSNSNLAAQSFLLGVKRIAPATV